MSSSDRRRGLPRIVDATLAAFGLVATLPLIVVLGLLVRITSPGPAIFRQTRVGRHGRPFELLKLRSMRTRTRREPSGAEVTAGGDVRITPIGAFLRRFKLDELPQLWNVFRGDMALVGPRPEVPRYVDIEDPRWIPVLAVRPGLTDAVTLRLRDEESLLAAAGSEPEAFYRRYLLPWKLAGYAAYEQRRTMRSDFGILLRTVLALVAPTEEPPPTVEEIEVFDQARTADDDAGRTAEVSAPQRKERLPPA